MHTVTIVLVLLFAVVMSTFMVRLLPLKIPLPLLQIALGAGLSWLGFQVRFDSHLFLLLFIPPLLFLDGWRIPKGAFFRDWKTIISLATGLVVFTVIGLGYFIHWLIPAIPLAVAFALAAILSPTDPVAVSAIAANSPIHTRLMHILEGESLLNDASGLVCFSFAVTAMMTGSFAAGDAVLEFFIVAGGGICTGMAIVWIIGLLNRRLIQRTGEEPAIQILISLLIPFAAYLTAEHFGLSGILAAVVAGIAMHYHELSGPVLATTRMQRTSVWDTVQTALNGIIFILLGEQLPGMLASLPDIVQRNGITHTGYLPLYILVITLGLGVLRYLWVWISVRTTHFSSNFSPTAELENLYLLIMAAAGVRGAITLAGILTLPLLLLDGSAFPARDLAISIAMGVIMLSLLIASIALPMLTRHLPPDTCEHQTSHIESARLEITNAAIRRLETLSAVSGDDHNQQAIRAAAVSHLLDIYRRRLQHGDPDENTREKYRQVALLEYQLHIEALRAERDELYRLRLSGSLDDEAHRKLVREIDLMEASLSLRRI
ncbi:Na+/H+ antiporter [Cellvibrio japonicus]|uniref:Na+/H+ antiporter n=1 Tax=Cellvibrio japonicus (strain Ueda107) TaxID=498211 RepID=B3PDQ4_CELJU|nr:Na+/H+ antiporter [Cellvibrio japonicus]ACE85040.1 Na+/H+ antiporter [Cellvibrio japonicus Ueda107]QEI12060.1 Na+/H+ antiporter [Cellvibrio japonicus]QEI15634.1 Na+/H+ antiporter [Cellvibrio japonicus]QEI19212.1 Na+/H+ antiporter [Cellvibrio japonicus]